MGSEASIWMLALFLVGLAAMAWLTVREASLYERRTAVRNVKKLRKSPLPPRERLNGFSRLALFVKSLWAGSYLDHVAPEKPVSSNYDLRLRREIDKLVGKEVYQGQKEQL
jgi:hypothetical protein